MTDVRRDLRRFSDAVGPTVAERERGLDRMKRTRRRRRIGPMVVGLGVFAAGLAAAMALVTSAPSARPIGPSPTWTPLTGDWVAHSTGHGTLGDGFVAWEDGALRASAPRDLHLRILTPEAVIEVEGSGFGVSRDEIGTEVTLERGRLTIWCTGETELDLPVFGRHTCFRNADAGLGYVLRQRAAGEAPADWLREVDRSLALRSGTPAASTELRGFRVEALLALGRFDEARETALALLVDPGSARGPVASVARRLVEQGDCAGARPFLVHLSEQGDGVASVWLADCTADPAERLRVLREGLADPRPEVRAAIDLRIGDQPRGHRSLRNGR